MLNIKDLLIKAKKFYDDKKFFEAEDIIKQVIEDVKLDNSIRLKLYVLLSDICYKINNFNDAELYLLKYYKEDGNNSEILNSLGNIYEKKRDFKNSEIFYLKSIQENKNNEIALSNLAILYHNLGREKDAKKFYNKVLSINSNNIGALYNLSNIDKSIIDEKKITLLKNLIKNEKLNTFDIASCYFILAENEKKNKNFDKEIDLLKQANEFSYQKKKSLHTQFNNYWLKVLPTKFDKIKYNKIEGEIQNTDGFYPIFIIGLPRCGSTLIESVISSGVDNVQNLGETNLVNWAFLNINRNLFIDNNNVIKNSVNLKATADRLLTAIKNLSIKKNSHGKYFFSEKSLENFFYVELLLEIFPNAKFINPNRNPFDNIYAIYKQFLSNISWSHSIENILIYIDNYLKIIDFLKKKYPDKILSISLEDFTSNPKKFAMQIFNFCNLEWTEKCLDFYKRDDLFINTASNNQIRNSITKYDSNKYKVYRDRFKKYFDNYNWIKNY